MAAMLQLVIVASKGRETLRGGIERDEIRQLNARSLALSALLGTHPPALPARALVALAELFGMAGGTMRTALSRMAAAGEVESDAGWYRLTGRLLARQQAQDIGRRPAADNWDGRWHTVIAAADQRDLADRRHFRAVLTDHRFGELRPDTWLRPANLPIPELGGSAFVVTGTLADGGSPSHPGALVDRLWDLESLGATARLLLDRIARLRATIDLRDDASLPETFTVSAAIVRFLRNEPLLPPALVPPRWPVDELRRAYDDLEHDLQANLRRFLRSSRDRTAPGPKFPAGDRSRFTQPSP
ncbi:MAG TPA: PaaX family transcriptional regulator C-terminal domain-containing protein [Ilumatobacter sp.]|nr:PaaX family transcriptional regulator C-terminal domain-containing protein [Ilumatobacter sp.]